MAKRKRAPGAGRKPKGEFANLASPFSLRMPKELRGQLENAVKHTGRSVSQEILIRIAGSFHREREKAKSSQIRALCFLITQIAEAVSLTDKDAWRTDPFVFKAFQCGVSTLLAKMEPDANAVSFIDRLPSTADKSRLNSDNHGRWTAETLWDNLQRATPEQAEKNAENVVDEILQSQDHDLFSKDLLEYFRSIAPFLRQELKNKYTVQAYGMVDARRDLKIPAAKTKE